MFNPVFPFCDIFENINIIIHAIHLPVRVSWDPDLVNASACRSETIMTNSSYCQMVNCDLSVMDSYNIHYHCLPQKHTFVAHFDPADGLVCFLVEVQGIGDTILHGFQLIFRPGWGCGYTVGIDAVTPLSELRAYPNPAADLLYIAPDTDLQNRSGNLSLVVYNAQGSMFSCPIDTRDKQHIALDIAALPTGFYIGHLHTAKMVRTFKFAKW